MHRRSENSGGFELDNDPMFFEGCFGSSFDAGTVALRVLKSRNRIVGDLNEEEASASVRRSRIVGGQVKSRILINPSEMSHYEWSVG
jgi:hypothetical protein